MGNPRNKLSFIGLYRSTVQLKAYNPAWAEAFRVDAAELAQQVADAELPPLSFAHIGSTSGPGLHLGNMERWHYFKGTRGTEICGVTE